MDERIREAIFRQVDQEPFAKKFGLRLLELETGYSRVSMVFTPDMENLFAMAHGGAIFALVDEAFETASNSSGRMAVALNMSLTYTAAPSPGTCLIAEAREINQTTKTALYEIKVLDDRERLIAVCQATVYRTGKPLPFLEAAEKQG